MNETTILDLIKENFTTVLVILSGFGGAILTYLFNKSLSTKELSLSITGKIADKKIDAYENVIALVKELRFVITTYKIDEASNLITYPSSLQSMDHFYELFTKITLVINKSSHWIDIKTTRELSFLQDYIATLSNHLKPLEDLEAERASEVLQIIGILIKQDFIDISAKLESTLLASYPENIINLEISAKRGWHKYKIEQTQKRFFETYLSKNAKEVKKLVEDTTVRRVNS